MGSSVDGDGADRELAEAQLMEELGGGHVASGILAELEPELNVHKAVDEMDIEKHKDNINGSGDVQREAEDLQPLADRKRRHDGDAHPRARPSDDLEAEKMADEDKLQQQEDHQDSSPAESTQPLKMEGFDIDGDQHRENVQNPQAGDGTDRHPVEDRGVQHRAWLSNEMEAEKMADVDRLQSLEDFDGEQHREDVEDPQPGDHDETDRQKMEDCRGVQDRARLELSEEMAAKIMADVDTVQQQEDQHDSSPAENAQPLKVEEFDGEQHRENVQDPRPGDTTDTQDMEDYGTQQQQRDTLQDPQLTDIDDSPTCKLQDVESHSQAQHEHPEDCRVADGTHAQKSKDLDTNNLPSREMEEPDAQKLLEDPHDPWPLGETELRKVESSSLNTQRQGEDPQDAQNTHAKGMKDTQHVHVLLDGLQQPGQLGCDTQADEMERSDSQQDYDSMDQQDSKDAGKCAAARCGEMKQQQCEDARSASPAEEMHESEMHDMDIRQQLEHSDHHNMEGGEFLRQSQRTEDLTGTMGPSDQMQHQPQNREFFWYRIPNSERQNNEQRDSKDGTFTREQNFSTTSFPVVLTTPEQEFQPSEHCQDKTVLWDPQMHMVRYRSGGHLELLKPGVHAIKSEDTPPQEQTCQRSDFELSLEGNGSAGCPPVVDNLRNRMDPESGRIGSPSCKMPDAKLEKQRDMFNGTADTWTRAKRSTIFFDRSEKPDGAGAELATKTDNQPVPLSSAVLNFIDRMIAPADHAVAHAHAQMKNKSWPTCEITRQLLETSIIGQQGGASNSATASMSDAAITTDQISDFGKINVGYTSAPELEAETVGHFEATPAALEPVNDLGGSDKVAAALQALQNLPSSEEGASEIPESNRSSAFTGKSGVCDDLGEAVTTLLPENSKDENFQAPSAAMAGTLYATETQSSESKSFEHLQYPTMSRAEEASRASALERQIATTSRVRAEIMSHPVFPEMLAAHGACLRITIPDNHMLGVSEQLMRSQELLRAYSPCVPVHDERGDSSQREQVNCFMRSHTDALWDLHAQLEDSVSLQVKNALLFTSRVENEIKNLSSASKAQDFDNNSDTENNRAPHSQHTAETMSDEFGPIVPTGSEHSIMKGIRDQLKQKYGPEGFWKKITEVRDEIVRKRRAGKLPTGTTAILKEWWNQHIEWPYPAEEDKERFMEETGLELKQINNWFINQRKRNWNSGASSSKSNERRNKQRA